MVPREPEDISKDEDVSDPQSEQGDSESNASQSQHGLEEEAKLPQEMMEEEYHTEESDEDIPRDDQDEYEDSDIDIAPPSAPLLPNELLKPLPSPAYSAQNAISIPWNQMTPKQKKLERNRSRKAKKRVWDDLKRDANGTGVLEKGRRAQLKRGVVSVRNKVKSGRVAKKTKTQTSGRQQLLEQRKRQVEQETSALMRPSKKPKTRSKR